MDGGAVRAGDVDAEVFTSTSILTLALTLALALATADPEMTEVEAAVDAYRA